MAAIGDTKDLQTIKEYEDVSVSPLSSRRSTSLNQDNITTLATEHAGQPDRQDTQLSQAQMESQNTATAHRNLLLKYRIRQAKLISRILATILSIASFIPVAITLAKFENTKNVYRAAPATSGPRKGEIVDRNPWAAETKLWPTTFYVVIGALSFIFNSTVMASYFYSVRRANRVAGYVGYFDWTILLGNLIVWIVAAAVYRKEKNLNGKSNDLWGWSCSPGAQAIQKAFNDQIHFNSICNAQSISWYFGLAQGATISLWLLVFGLAVWRRRIQKEQALQEQEMINHAYEGSSGARNSPVQTEKQENKS